MLYLIIGIVLVLFLRRLNKSKHIEPPEDSNVLSTNSTPFKGTEHGRYGPPGETKAERRERLLNQKWNKDWKEGEPLIDWDYVYEGYEES